MHPELIQQVKRRHAKKHQRRHAEHSHRHIKDPAEDKPRTGLAQRGGQVVILTLVMH